MPKTKKTDLQVLRAVLSLPRGKLSSNEKTVFQRMYDDVAGGMVISLSKKQRAWVDGVYDKHDLDKPQNRGNTEVKVLDKSRLHKEPASQKPHYHVTDKGKAQIEAILARARELGLPNPIPDEMVPQLIDVIPSDVKELIVKKVAASKTLTVESLSAAYLRRLLKTAEADERRFSN
jgi:hypothetical protein